MLFLNKFFIRFFTKNIFLFLLVTYIVSRLFFLSKYPFFYDSPEYLRESFSNSFFSSLQRSHESIHPVYLFLIQLFQKIIPGQSAWSLSLISGLFGIGSFILFYVLIKKLFSQKIAICSLVPLIFFKHIWLIETNILHESVNHFFLIAGILSFTYFLDNKKYYLVILPIVFWSLGILNFPGIIIWFIPIYAFVLVRRKLKKKDFIYLTSSIIVSLFIGLIINKTLLDLSKVSGLTRLEILYKDYGINILFRDFSVINIARSLRNITLILLNGYSLASLLSIVVYLFLKIKEKNTKMIIFSLLFLIPLFFTGKYWYGGLYGRYSSFIAYFLAIAFSFIYLKSRKLYFALLFILVFSFIPTLVKYQKTPIFLIQESLIKKVDTKSNDIIILSDYQRPQLEISNSYCLSPDSNKNSEIENLINDKLLSNNRVFITKQAINYPYWQYDGQEIHIVSKGNLEKAYLRNYLSEKKITLVSFNEEYPFLGVYEIKSK
ncbi:MAG: glycosyltransferase family 39 protein [Patescibacteria group bacterium]